MTQSRGGVGFLVRRLLTRAVLVTLPARRGYKWPPVLPATPQHKPPLFKQTANIFISLESRFKPLKTSDLRTAGVLAARLLSCPACPHRRGYLGNPPLHSNRPAAAVAGWAAVAGKVSNGQDGRLVPAGIVTPQPGPVGGQHRLPLPRQHPRQHIPPPQPRPRLHTVLHSSIPYHCHRRPPPTDLNIRSVGGGGAVPALSRHLRHPHGHPRHPPAGRRLLCYGAPQRNRPQGSFPDGEIFKRLNTKHPFSNQRSPSLL